MLPCLRHHGVIRSHDEHDKIVSRCPGEHIADESLMTRHIHDSKFELLEGQTGKTNVDRHTTSLLFGQSIGINPSQRPHQGRFPVVDVPGRSENESLRCAGSRHFDIYSSALGTDPSPTGEQVPGVVVQATCLRFPRFLTAR